MAFTCLFKRLNSNYSLYKVLINEMVINQNKQTGHMKCYNGQLEEKTHRFSEREKTRKN